MAATRGDKNIFPSWETETWFIHCTISTLTVVVPCLTKSNLSATARDTSTIRLRDRGPQSLTVATTFLPFFVFVILTFVPHGRLRCAVVSSDATYVPPQAVLWPSNAPL